MDVGDHVLAVNAVDVFRCRAQRDVQHGTIFRNVDRLASKHQRAVALYLGGFGQRQEVAHDVGIDQVLGVVEQEIAEGQ